MQIYANLCLARRKSVLARLFPPIPRMRVPLEAEPGEMVRGQAWGDGGNAEMLTWGPVSHD